MEREGKGRRKRREKELWFGDVVVVVVLLLTWLTVEVMCKREKKKKTRFNSSSARPVHARQASVRRARPFASRLTFAPPLLANSTSVASNCGTASTTSQPFLQRKPRVSNETPPSFDSS